MILVLLSAAQGPSECCFAVAKISQILIKQAESKGLKVTIVDQLKGERSNTFKSILMGLEGEQSKSFALEWCGSIQWRCQSPFRPHHKRKNWFISSRLIGSIDQYKSITRDSSDDLEIKKEDISFEACRSSGPGGQHVNKTNSAIRAVHLPSGEFVKVDSQRSQHANKKLAVLLLQDKLLHAASQYQQGQRQKRHQLSKQVERGGAVKVFEGEQFLASSG
ncbi:MAG: peptide chain release factor H [Gammaproteobacteria bacterium]|nr:peptide chain release factor H [Gammaproteobacteria bacterium]